MYTLIPIGYTKQTFISEDSSVEIKSSLALLVQFLFYFEWERESEAVTFLIVFLYKEEKFNCL